MIEALSSGRNERPRRAETAVAATACRLAELAFLPICAIFLHHDSVAHGFGMNNAQSPLQDADAHGIDTPMPPVQGASLGARLALSMQREAEEAAARTAADAARREQRERAERLTVDSFFEYARDLFTALILGNTPTSQLAIQVGDGGRHAHRASSEAASLLRAHSVVRMPHAAHTPALATNRPPASIREGGRWAAQYEDFVAWARIEGLAVQWQDEHDGVGLRSWHVMRVVPIGSLP